MKSGGSGGALHSPEDAENCADILRSQPSLVAPQLRRLDTSFPQRWPGFEPWSRHVGFEVGKMAIPTAKHWSCGAGTIGPIVADVSSHPEKFKKKKWNLHCQLCNANDGGVFPRSRAQI
jgi:hypothetical protein